MKHVEAYQTSDLKLFLDERKAKKHQDDIIGKLLDGLLPHDNRGNVTMVDRHNLLMEQLNDKELKDKISNLFHALTHEDINL